ncbi:MAG TPA: hypothetical protein VK491_04815, partial [Gemmatimonadaceae bacterium]|nr:hypothetical protein [Gemmatimonadaceae bacterium]
MRSYLNGIAAAALFVACSTSKPDAATPDSLASAEPDSALPLASQAGFIQPEAVRYDPDQDLYFVGNWGKGEPDAKDNNGFISRLTPDGVVERPRFIAGGTAGAT